MIIKLEPDWSNWDIYRDVIVAYLNSKGLGVFMMKKAMQHVYKKMDPFNVEHYTEYLTKEGGATLILFESLPESIYRQLVTKNTFLEKWNELNRLYSEHSNASKVAIEAIEAQSQLESTISQPQATSLPLAGNLKPDTLRLPPPPAQYHATVTANPYGDNHTPSTDLDGKGGVPAFSEANVTDEQRPFLNRLKQIAVSDNCDILGHLTVFESLRESLAHRGAILSDLQFLEYLSDSFYAMNSPGIYSLRRLLVKSLVERMKIPNSLLSGRAEGTRGTSGTVSSVDEVLGVLAEFERQTTLKHWSYSEPPPVRTPVRRVF
ncbi:hypothetical protein CVT24_006964 [Panaeolus cyanescens]|uniref:Uncharacterized protein n=1 Tax=Panaeolus cyanescens TaxID=181874 RepID=A0A409YX39_9AGAR|nr:hypothetical protein CVT24_006964 [Panaeolus cyanescens]